MQGADATVLALRFTVLESVIDEMADSLTDKVVVVPSNPVGLDAHGNVVRLLSGGQSSGAVVAGWLPTSARLAMAFGTMSADLFESSSNRSPEPAVLFYVSNDVRAAEEVERLIRTAGFEAVKAGGIEESTRGGRRPSRSRRRLRRGAIAGRQGLIASSPRPERTLCSGLVDLRVVGAEIRPDWDLSKPGLRVAWDADDY